MGGGGGVFNNDIAVNLQYDKIDQIKKDVEFRIDDPLRNDIYLLKTKNYIKQTSPPPPPLITFLSINIACILLTFFSGIIYV